MSSLLNEAVLLIEHGAMPASQRMVLKGMLARLAAICEDHANCQGCGETLCPTCEIGDQIDCNHDRIICADCLHECADCARDIAEDHDNETAIRYALEDRHGGNE